MRKFALVFSVFISSVFLYYFGLHYFPDSTVDDAYILYRYADNLINGYGFRWNPYGVTADGFTNLFWVLILSMSSWLTSYPVHEIAPVVGIAVASATCLVCLIISYRLVPSNKWKWAASFTPILISLSPIFIRHSVSGMGTIAGMFSISLFVLSATYLPHKTGYIASAFTIFLCFLTRPESVLFCGVFIISLHFFVSEEPKEIKRPTIYFVIPALSLLSIFFIFRFSYFGHALPLPFYVKSGDFSWRDGLEKSLVFISYSSPYVLFSIVYIYIRDEVDTLKNIIISSILGTTFLFLYLLDVSSVMNYDFRYQSVVLPVFASISIPAVIGLKDPKGVYKYILPILLIYVTISNFGLIDKTRDGVWNDRWNRQGEIAKLISKHDSLVIASTEAGQIGYFSDNNHIDLTGLNTPSIALRGGKRSMSSADYERFLGSLPNLPDVYIYQTWPHPANLDNLSFRSSYICVEPFPQKTINACVLKRTPKYEPIISSLRKLN